MQNKFQKLASVMALFLLSTVQVLAQINVQVIPAANGCKGAVIYNNSNHILEVTLSYIYEANNGAYYSGHTIPYTINPRSSYTNAWLYHGPVDCSKPYNVRTNYTFVDKTAEAERVQAAQRAAQQRQAEVDRQRNEQRLREQKRLNDAAEARRLKENEEKKRQKEAELKRQKEIYDRKVQESKKPWGQGCPKGLHC